MESKKPINKIGIQALGDFADTKGNRFGRLLSQAR